MLGVSDVVPVTLCLVLFVHSWHLDEFFSLAGTGSLLAFWKVH
jgi:hypothetical protein